MKSPFVWFGGKRKVAPQVWAALGDVDNYVEPFAGSLAVLLERPHADRRRAETVNDKDGYIANFWRAVAADPDAVAHFADWPVNEADLMARHLWLVNEGRELIANLEGDPDFYDAKVAGWWVWGINAWIGGGWCSGTGPWVTATVEDGSKRPHLGNAGQGVNRKLPHLGNAGLTRASALRNDALYGYMGALAERLRGVRVVCGDWPRVVTRGALSYGGTVGVFLDPPYTETDTVDAASLYNEMADGIGRDVRDWCLANGDDRRLRIILAGYADEHDAHMPPTWRRVKWKAGTAYQQTSSAGKNLNRHKERLWLSPGCLGSHQQSSLFDEETE